MTPTKTPKPATPPQFRPPFYRRKWIVRPRFQIYFFLIFVGLVFVGQGILYYAIESSSSDLAQQFRIFKGPSSDMFVSIIKDQQQIWRDLFITLSAWMVGLVAIVSILVSHRIAGPVFRLCSELKSMAATGRLHPIRFRKGDCFQDVPEIFNQVVDSQAALGKE